MPRREVATRWSSGSRSTCSSRRARRRSAAAPRDFGAPPNANICPGLPRAAGRAAGAQRAGRRARGARRARARLQRHPRLDLRAQELLLSRPAEGLPDLAVRPAARHRRPSDDRRAHEDGGRSRSASRACTWRRTPASRCTIASRRDGHRSESRRRAAHRDRERAGHALRRARPARICARSSSCSSTST